MKLPTDNEIETEASSYDNCMVSIAEGVWMPEGFKTGAKWMRDKFVTPKQEEIKKRFFREMTYTHRITIGDKVEVRPTAFKRTPGELWDWIEKNIL